MELDPYLVGMIRGDGSISKRKDGAYAVWVDQAEKNHTIFEQGVLPRFQTLGPKVYSYRYYAKADKTYKHRALVYSKELYTCLQSTFRDIGAYIDQLSDGDARQFIAGVTDAEGTVTDRIIIYNKNKKLLKSIQKKLNELGITDSHIYKFGVVHGLQIYRRQSLKRFVGEIPAVKLRSSTDRFLWLEKPFTK
jgi:LAGLIDADG-like domain